MTRLPFHLKVALKSFLVAREAGTWRSKKRLRTSLTTVGRLAKVYKGWQVWKKRRGQVWGEDALGETGLTQAREGMRLIQKDYGVDGMRVILTTPHNQ